jgi:hypothetical protein
MVVPQKEESSWSNELQVFANRSRFTLAVSRHNSLAIKVAGTITRSTITSSAYRSGKPAQTKHHSRRDPQESERQGSHFEGKSQPGASTTR